MQKNNALFKFLYSFILFTFWTTSSAAETRFIAYGDMPYGEKDDVYPKMEALIKEINARKPHFVFHVGDSKGGEDCSDEILNEQLAFINSIDAPVIYTPGDNEWTDCHRYGGGDPLERLSYIRKTYFSTPNKSLGQKSIDLEHQGSIGYPENARFIKDNLMFVTAHIVGSNNGFEVTKIESIQESIDRSKASTDWLKESFKKAINMDAVILAIHADMFEFDFNEYKYEKWLRHSGFREFGEALKRSARAFDKPVLLIFGDSHKHRKFVPFPQYAPNITAIEVYGHYDMNAIEITADLEKEIPFKVKTIWNPAQNWK